MERIGQISVTCLALLCSDLNIKRGGRPILLLSIYGKNVPMLLAVTLLGIGHIGIHLQHRKEV